MAAGDAIRKYVSGAGWQTVAPDDSGGGGGSLPDWWTIDSTPGSESVEFGGAVKIRDPGDPTDGNSVLVLLDRDDAGPGSRFDTYGTWYGQAVQVVTSTDPDFAVSTLIKAEATAETSQFLIFNDASANEVMEVGPTGAVTVSPSDSAVDALTAKYESGETALYVGSSIFGMELDLRSEEGDTLTIGALGAGAGNLMQIISNTTFADSTIRFGNIKTGFFNAAPVAQPTGVAVDAAGIHAALVTLGLITA